MKIGEVKVGESYCVNNGWTDNGLNGPYNLRVTEIVAVDESGRYSNSPKRSVRKVKGVLLTPAATTSWRGDGDKQPGGEVTVAARYLACTVATREGLQAARAEKEAPARNVMARLVDRGFNPDAVQMPRQDVVAVVMTTHEWKSWLAGGAA